MANVQTVTTPQTALSGAPLSINPAPDAFGANVAGEGLQKVGAATEQVSDMLGKRALTVQAINNQSAADQANLQYDFATGQSAEKYKKDLLASLSKNPELDTGAFLGAYLKQNEADRIALASTLTNPMAQQMFHQESRQTAARNARSLAAETSTAWMQSGINTATASMKLYQTRAFNSGGDTSNPEVQAAMLGIWNQVTKIGAIRGDSPDAQKELFTAGVSPIFKSVFDRKLEYGDLDGAKKVLADHAAHDLTIDDIDKMQRSLRAGIAQDNIRLPVSDIYDKGVAPTIPGDQGSSSNLSPRAFFNAFIAPHEGSSTVIDSNGKAVQYGINSGTYPTAGVGHLTQSQAADIYERDFARKDLDPAMANAYGDTAFLAGRKEADSLLGLSHGDVNRFLDLRQTFLNNLVEANPAKYGKYAVAWQHRTEDLRQTVVGTGRAPVQFSEAPPKFEANADPSEIRDQMLAYNQRVAMAFPAGIERDRFRQDADQRAQLAANLANDHQTSVVSEIKNLILKGQLPNGNVIHSYDDIPPNLTSQLSPDYQGKVRELVTQARGGIGLFKTPEMINNNDRLRTLSGTDPTAFVNTDLQKIDLSSSDFNYLADLKSGMQRNKQKVAEREQKISVLTSNPFVKDLIAKTFEQAGAPYADIVKQGSANVMSPEHMSFLGALEGEVEKAQAASTKPLSQQEVGNLANAIMLQRAGQNHEDFLFIPDDVKHQLNQRYYEKYGETMDAETTAYYYHRLRK